MYITNVQIVVLQTWMSTSIERRCAAGAKMVLVAFLFVDQSYEDITRGLTDDT